MLLRLFQSLRKLFHASLPSLYCGLQHGPVFRASAIFFNPPFTIVVCTLFFFVITSTIFITIVCIFIIYIN